MSSKWNDTSVKDLTFAVIMSSNDGNVNIKANWDRVEQLMQNWGYDFTKGAMSQQWTKKILKEFRQRHPDTAGNGDNSSAPATPANKSGGSRAARAPKTPASGKAKAKGKKRPAAEDDDEGDSPIGGFNPNPIAKTKTPRKSAKKVKQQAESDAESVAESEEADEDADVVKQPKSEEKDEDYHFTFDV
ncbi:hypothetical protein VMCG_04429 [Cytospora schulzeri]|uniref:Uncharacterized protein n=1 Tax=Cytospora schulzeri TaxID=448051 RepID=A0A423WT72_9PEZI|nr:hypothetical protein VMCG_04429 [Valsa malicola]